MPPLTHDYMYNIICYNTTFVRAIIKYGGIIYDTYFVVGSKLLDNAITPLL